MRITQIKNGIIAAIEKILNANNIRCKITDDNFAEFTDNIPATVTEINVQYIESNWDKIQDNPYKQPNYNRTFVFLVRLLVKNIRDEDQIQDFNDLIVTGIGSNSFYNRYFTISNDRFDRFQEGFWIYEQTWQYMLEGIGDLTCNDTPLSFNELQVYISPSYNNPLIFDASKASEI